MNKFLDHLHGLQHQYVSPTVREAMHVSSVSTNKRLSHYKGNVVKTELHLHLFLCMVKDSWLFIQMQLVHCKNKTVVLTHLGLSQLQLQPLGLHYHAMCALLQCVINPYPVNYLR